MNYYNISRATQGLVKYLKTWVGRARSGGQETQARHRLRHAAFFARFRGPRRQGRHGKRLRRGPVRQPALDAGTLLRRAPDATPRRASSSPPATTRRTTTVTRCISTRARRSSSRRPAASSRRSRRYQGARRTSALHGAERGEEITMLGEEIDSAYLERLKTLVLDPGMLASGGGRAEDRVHTHPRHRRGALTQTRAGRHCGCHYITVPRAGSSWTGGSLRSNRPTRRTPRP